MPNKTIYIRREDEAIWDEAVRLLGLVSHAEYQGMSAFIMEHLKQFVAEKREESK